MMIKVSMLFVAGDDEAHGVLVRQGGGVDDTLIAAQGSDGDHLLALIMLCQGFPDLFAVEAGEEDGGGHALVEVAQDGAEQGRKIEAADLLHFRQVLVLQGQTVDPVALVADIPVFVLVFCDQSLAAAGVAGEGVGRQREPGIDDTLCHQRADGCDEAAVCRMCIEN